MSDEATILVVDDEVAIAEMLVEMLAEVGYRAEMAFDGPTALAFIVNQPPALLLLDVRMPRMSGIMLLDHLRKANLLKMPVVLMTAAPQDIPALRVEGVSAVLAKPFDFDALTACVAQAMAPACQRGSENAPHISSTSEQRSCGE